MIKDAPGFIYMKIYNDIREHIDGRSYKPGERLPGENELKVQYGVSRDTVRKALAKLEHEGYVTRRAATGTIVQHKKADYGLSRMESFSEQMRKRGVVPSSEVHIIELTSDPEPEVMEELQLSEGVKVYKVARIRKADDQPMAYEICYTSQRLCPDLHCYLSDNASLYDIYENKFNLKLSFGRIQLEAELPSSQMQKLLKIKSTDAVLKMRCTAMLEDRTPLYCVVGYYIGNQYIFSTTLPR